MTLKSNPVGWFEIPVEDMERAMAFYGSVFNWTLKHTSVGPIDMAWFPSVDDAKGSAGALVKHDDWYEPSDFEGVLIYFTAQSGDVDVELKRVAEAGGEILQPKKAIGEYGFVAFFLDTEGNRIGLHSRT